MWLDDRLKIYRSIHLDENKRLATRNDRPYFEEKDAGLCTRNLSDAGHDDVFSIASEYSHRPKDRTFSCTSAILGALPFGHVVSYRIYELTAQLFWQFQK